MKCEGTPWGVSKCNLKALPGEFQNALVIADIDKKNKFADRCEDHKAIFWIIK